MNSGERFLKALDNILVLHIGEKEWDKNAWNLPPYVIMTSINEMNIDPSEIEEQYDLVFVERDLTQEECDRVFAVSDTYRLYVVDTVEKGAALRLLYKRMQGKMIAAEEVERFLQEEAHFFYKSSYGEKFRPGNLRITGNYQGEVWWKGNYSVTVSGDWGEKYCQVMFYKNTIPIEEGQSIDFWLEYFVTGSVEVKLSIVMFPQGTTGYSDLEVHEYTMEDLESVITLQSLERKYMFVSLYVKGKGDFELVALHDRYSRGKHGCFIPGGKRYVTSKREEIFAYFDPGDLKPPLTVYFSGYKTREGFEGHGIMKRAGGPFLLIADQRLKGGCYYMGSEEYEALMQSVIREHLALLGFTNRELILAGISMGSTGSLYYGCFLEPHAVVAGKPLVHVGSIAQNELLLRPGGFPTSLDALCHVVGGSTEEYIEKANRKFWKAFNKANYSHTKFSLAYMRGDDYDQKAYETLLSNLRHGGVQVRGKGLSGRHNDDTRGIVKWFLSQYTEILRDDFGRK